MTKLFSALLLLLSVAFCAQPDAKMYDGDNLLEYYTHLGTMISQENPETIEAEERIKNEKALLQKLQDIVKSNGKEHEIAVEKFDSKNINANSVIAFFDKIALSVKKINRLESNEKLIQDKLAYLNKEIENEASDENPNLRLYQLQFAYYKLKQKKDKNDIKSLRNYVKNAKEVFLDIVTKVDFKLDKDYDTLLTKEIELLDKKLVALNLNKERELLSQEEVSKELALKIKELEKRRNKKIKELMDQSIVAALFYVKNNNIEKIIETQDYIEVLESRLSKKNSFYHCKIEFLDEVVKKSTSASEYMFPKLKSAISSIGEDVYATASAPLLVVDEVPISLLSILKVFGIFILGLFVARLYLMLMSKFYSTRKDKSYAWIKTAANLGFILIVFSSLVMAIASIGLSITNLAVIAGVISIGLGFALKGIVSSMVSGMVMFGENYIRVGDYIKFGADNIVGKVIDIGFRASNIRTIDNIHIIVPNSELTDNRVINLTLNDRIRRIYIPFKVGYGENIPYVKELIVDAVLNSDIKLLREPVRYKPNVWMTHMAESYIELDLLVWIEGLRPSTKSNLLILIYETLQTNGISMPFPQLDMHIKREEIEEIKNTIREQ
ncbi:MAG: mechanosensitive ion channel [Campylobacterales bacterium]|nr:mechanosensitive ion channel [Campylobacterales bacterium]